MGPAFVPNARWPDGDGQADAWANGLNKKSADRADVGLSGG